MHITKLEIPDVKIITPDKHEDGRGFFSEIYSAKTLREAGINLDIVQENYSLSTEVNTLRGLHFQTPPFAQDKLVQVVQGAILDVAVDIRRGSPWFGKYVAAEISAANWRQILVPKGFAHGFCTLTPDTAVIYKVTGLYSREHDRGIRWNDPAIGIDWPVRSEQAVLSDKDLNLPLLADCDTLFDYRAGDTP